MHVFQFSFYLSLTLYVIIYQHFIAACFLTCVAIYIIISIIYPSSKNLSTRRKLALANWPPPSEGVIYNNISLRVDKFLAFLQTIPKQKRPTITHYVVKACGQVLKENPELNGKLVFGKFVPYQTCDVCCLVNIDEGNDVGMMLIKDVPNKTVLQIANQIQTVGKKIRPKGGDEIHKKRMGLLHILPSFLVSIIFKISIFLTSHIGLNAPFVGLTKDSLGSMIVTSVGAFGYIDAYTPFFGSTGQWILMTVNAIHDEVIADEGKPVVAKIINVNCVIDHRYLYSGGKGKNLISKFKQVFDFPQKYLGEEPQLKESKKLK